jgi:hypothetical protein
MKKIILFVFFHLLMVILTEAQSNLSICKGLPNDSTISVLANPLCSPTSTTYINKYRLQQTYIPTSNTALITLNITLHVFTYDDGTAAPGLFSSDTSSIGNPALLQNYISWLTNDVGERYSSQRNANYEPTFMINQITDSKFRYVVSHIYYYPISAIHSNTNTSAYTCLNYINTNYPDRLKEGLPILFNNSNSFGFQSFYNGLPFVAAGVNYYDLTHFKNHLLHEIGHALGWGHTYQDFSPSASCYNYGADWTSTQYNAPCGSIDYLSDVFAPGQSYCYFKQSAPPPICQTYVSANSNNTCLSCYEVPNTGLSFESNNVMGGSQFYPATWWSPLQMGRRIRSMRLNAIRTFAKDTPSDHVNTWNITTNETWDFDIQLYEDIVIKSGNTLNITCKVNMATDGRIIVEKGAKLIIDGGEITTWSKQNIWDGIYIEGSGNGTPQNLTYQGQLEVKNGGTITNANVAVNTFIKDAYGNINWATTGGMIFCDNANFINNVKDVQFMYYHGLAINNNVCIFKNTNFKITGPLKNNALPDSRVSLYEVNGVKFLGCNFENTTGSTIASPNYGINSIDAIYTVDKLNTTNTTIKGFAQGLRVDNSNPLKLPMVKNTNFIGNLDNGAYFNNTNNLIFENNTFIVSSKISTQNYMLYSNGLYINNSKYYTIKNNTFNSNLSEPQINENSGITVNNSQNGSHFIYKNNFGNLDYGIWALNNNSGQYNTTDGLLINCNDFTIAQNGYDILLHSESSLATINSNQGVIFNPIDPTKLVRNRYSAPNNCYNCEKQFYIYDFSAKNYLHDTHLNLNHQPLPQPPLSDLSVIVTTVGITYNNVNCPIDPFSPPNPCISCSKITNINNVITNAQNNYNSSLVNYLNFIDGGNTSTLVTAFNNNMSNGNLKNLLQSKGPYISDTVLKAYFTRSATPPDHIKEIHALNAPVSADVWQTIIKRNLPSGIMNQITVKQNEKKFSKRDLLYAQLSRTKSDLQVSVSAKINYYATDTLSESSDSLIKTLELNRGKMDNNMEQLFFAYLNNNDINNANKTALDIQHQKLSIYLRKLINLHQSSNRIFTLKQNKHEIIYFSDVAIDTTSMLFTGSKSLLKMTNVITYSEPRGILHQNNSTNRANIVSKNDSINSNSIKVFPNPTSENFHLVIENKDEKDIYSIIISNTLGTKLFETTLEAKNLISIKNMPIGVYLINIYRNYELIKSDKILKIN